MSERSPIRVSVSVSYQFSPRKYERCEVSAHISQIPLDANEDEIRDAQIQAHQLLAVNMAEIFNAADEATAKAKARPKPE